MRINKSLTLRLRAYSNLQRHRNEPAFSATWSPTWCFTLSVWEWSWHFGFGTDDHPAFYGIFISWSRPGTNYNGPYPGYWTWALSTKLWWESHLE